ncbi:hypothetical protein [Roseovarius indicus]|uniref:Uncharacterized protein n=1 Tax=Roseovarius indicus TaxID=540747 RepID=A0A0T5P680_9RHOB|nr:hypothetical protein [Roseovarius indicus]KRS16548.1 hypothetical protein XM52_18350 [Roseovarius indicus]QEW28199.1 hypothetical protein RIdsm_04026 [Roseovarius indicus]SFE56215.1 hypothetical protein SAMN04488031_112127 [Roseovarius indicus]
MKIVIQRISRIDEDGTDRLEVDASAVGFNIAAQFMVHEIVKSNCPIPDDIEERVAKGIRSFLDEIKDA